MRKREYRRFTKDFRLEVNRLAGASGKPVTQVARELGSRLGLVITATFSGMTEQVMNGEC